MKLFLPKKKCTKKSLQCTLYMPIKNPWKIKSSNSNVIEN